MAGIDYNIANQIKGVQLESPMNAMAQAMQLRGLQEAAQLNALKMQEYQQQQQESNELAQIIRNPKFKYGTPEFFAEVAARAPRRYADLAAGYEKQKLGEAAEEDRRQKTLKTQFEQRQLKREFGLRKIAGAPDYGQAAGLIERSVRSGEIDREEADDLLSRLNPDADMAQFKSDVLTNLLPAKEALTAASDVEKAQLGVRKEKSELEAKELDRSLAGFNKSFSPAFISITDKNLGRAQVTQRLKAMYDYPTLGEEAKRFISYEDALKQHLDLYENDPEGYIGMLTGMTGEKIIEARNKKNDEAYEEYKTKQILDGNPYVTKDAFLASRVAKPNIPVTATEPAAAPAPAIEPAAAPAPAPAPALEAVVASTAATGTKALPPVAVDGKLEGFDFLDPQAEKLYKYAATLKDSTKAASVRAAANAIQQAYEKTKEAKRKEGDFSADYQDVMLARKKVQELKKLPPTPEILEQIDDLLDMIKTSKQGKGTKVSQNVQVSAEKKYGEKFAGNIADADVALRDAAERAPDTAANANRILSLLQSGQVITGSAANVKLQMAKFLNLGGGNDSEAVTNTEVLISSLADSTLGAIKSSGLGSGQGFTDKDREFLERAKAGQITYEATSLKRLAELAHKAAGATADKWNKRVKTIPKSAIEGTGISTDAISVPALLKSNTRSQLPTKNADGWELKEDANGRRAYVSPDGKQFKEVK